MRLPAGQLWVRPCWPLVSRPRRPGIFTNAFFITTKDGLQLLVKRVPGQTRPVVLFVLKKSVPRPTKHPLTETVHETLDKELDQILAANIKDALATAR